MLIIKNCPGIDDNDVSVRRDCRSLWWEQHNGVQVHEERDDGGGEHLVVDEDWSPMDWMLAFSAALACFSSFLQICFELAEVTSAPGEYVTDPTNVVDWVSCCFVFYIVVEGLRFGPLHQWRAISAALLQLVWFKFFGFMRPFEFTSSFVPLLQTILVDMVPFIGDAAERGPRG